MEDSQGFNQLSKSMHAFEQTTVQPSIQKPLFNSFAKIGGLGVKKKDDKLKFIK